jgi:hypothetical protein
VVARLEELCTYCLRDDIAPYVADPGGLAAMSEPQCLDPLEIAANNKSTF